MPYKSRPFLPALSLSSDDDYSPGEEDDDDESDKGSEYEDMFCHSLPSSRCFQGLSWSAPETTDADVNQSECLDETQNENNKDADQSEDEIPAAPPDKSEEHLSSEVLKTDENKKEEDAENDKHSLM